MNNDELLKLINDLDPLLIGYHDIVDVIVRINALTVLVLHLYGK